MSKNKLLTFIFVLIFAVSLLLRLLPSLNYNFPFTMDQGRDMLDIRNIVVGHHPTLIGPTTSVNGVFLGPFWYYFNVIPYASSFGNPSSLVYWMTGWYMLSSFILWQILKKSSLIFALISSLLFLMAPILFFVSRFSWSANPMPFFTIFYFLCLISYLGKTSSLNSTLLGLVIGLSLQIEAAFGILFFPFVIIVSFFKKIPLKFVGVTTLSFFVTLLPQILFELRHNFLMTNTFISELTGKSQILGNKLNFFQTLQSHFTDYTNIPHGLMSLPQDSTTPFFSLAIIYLLLRTRFGPANQLIKLYFLSSSLFIMYSFAFYLLYPYSLKGWYLLGLNIPYLFILSCFFTDLLSFKKPVLIFLISLLLGYSFFNTFKEQSNYIPKDKNFISSDKSSLKNELVAIDWVYKKANGQGFKVYNYIPSVYDFPYQYLFWWYGTKTYGYQPDTITYKDGVPEYIAHNLEYWTKRKPVGQNPPIFLIYEKDDLPRRLYAWLGDFTDLCVSESQSFSWGTTVEKRIAC